MNKIKGFFAVILSFVCMLVSFSDTANAASSLGSSANASGMKAYGFDVPNSGYWYTGYFNQPTVINVYSPGGVYIGSNVIVVARARATVKDSSGYYYDTIFIRQQMEPVVTRSNGQYYRGINNSNSASMTLYPKQQYVNIGPAATMPESSSTWNVSCGGNINSKKDFGFSLSTGYSSTTKDNCYTVTSNYTSSNKKYKVSYDYTVSANVFSTAARKAINKWCANTHQCFYAYTYRTPSTNTINMNVDYYANFRYATTSYGGSWDGSTWDVILDSSGRSGTANIYYLYSN